MKSNGGEMFERNGTTELSRVRGEANSTKMWPEDIRKRRRNRDGLGAQDATQIDNWHGGMLRNGYGVRQGVVDGVGWQAIGDSANNSVAQHTLITLVSPANQENHYT